MITKGE